MQLSTLWNNKKQFFASRILYDTKLRQMKVAILEKHSRINSSIFLKNLSESTGEREKETNKGDETASVILAFTGKKRKEEKGTERKEGTGETKRDKQRDIRLSFAFQVRDCF